jgi:hypothetical protein
MGTDETPSTATRYFRSHHGVRGNAVREVALKRIMLALQSQDPSNLSK